MNPSPALLSGPREFVTFTLAGEDYGVDVANVQEIINYRGFTRIPNVAEFIKGVLNLRGTVVPVVDLRVKFRLEAAPYDKYTVILIVEVAGRVMGVVVDRVTDVLVLAPEEVRPAPSFSAATRTRHIRGMAEKDGKFLILLDIDRVLSPEELELVDAA